MSLLTRWFERWQSRDKRKAERRPWPPLVAHYWTGAAPAAQRIRDISATGLYLLTEARWYPGTVIKITLQSPGAESDHADGEIGSGRSISVQSKVVRQGEDGVGLEFVLPQSKDQRQEYSAMNVVADQNALNRFLQRLGEENAEVIVDVE